MEISQKEGYVRMPVSQYKNYQSVFTVVLQIILYRLSSFKVLFYHTGLALDVCWSQFFQLVVYSNHSY